MTKDKEKFQRSTHFNEELKMWVLRTENQKGERVRNDEFMVTKSQADAWVEGTLEEGNCYEAASKLLFSKTCPVDASLCHGTVVGQGPVEGSIFGHAWIEYRKNIPMAITDKVNKYSPKQKEKSKSIDLTMVMDHSNGKKTTMSKELYYFLGKIRDVKYYSKKEAKEKLLSHLTYGPWDD
jgi:hypothetical protein